MKKLILIAVISLFVITATNAQEIGIRFDYAGGSRVALDGVFGLAKFSRIHADVSFGNGGVGIDALWDFLYKPLGGEALNWYLGAGPYVDIQDPFWLGVAGEIGLEYRFKGAPVALGIDWRPKFSIIDVTGFNADVFGINIRYVIGKK